jgi:RecA-family ATPase
MAGPQGGEGEMSDAPELTEAAMHKQMLLWDFQEKAQRAEVRKREPPKRVEILTLAELFEQPDPIWLIEGWLQEDSLAVIAGPSDTGKSFVALSIGCCIASDVDWFGHATQHGQVTYVYSEGSSGIKKRVDAWLKAHGKAT